METINCSNLLFVIAIDFLLFFLLPVMASVGLPAALVLCFSHWRRR